MSADVEKNAFVLAAFLKALFERRATVALVVSMSTEKRQVLVVAEKNTQNRHVELNSHGSCPDPSDLFIY